MDKNKIHLHVAGEEFSNENYVPIGNFFVIEGERTSNLPSESTTATIQERILKEPLCTVKISNVKDGHQLAHYRANLTRSLSDHELQKSLKGKKFREIQQKDTLKPYSKGRASIVWSKADEVEPRTGEKSTWRCRLLLPSESHHLCLQPLATRGNNFRGFPFKASSTYDIKVSGEA